MFIFGRKKLYCLSLLISLLAHGGRSQQISIKSEEKGIGIYADHQLLIFYQTVKEPVPRGVDSIFSKSGFLHPVNTLSGQTLTRIQPEDHYHHYGIWGPWTKTSIEDRNVDFWNIGDGTGRVEFDSLISCEVKEEFAEITVLQKHWDVQGNQIAMREVLTIRVWKPSSNHYLLEYTSRVTALVKIKLEDYRYGGGLGFRGRADWHSENSKISTSEGLDRAEADGSLAEWLLLQGPTRSIHEKGGLLIMSHPENWSHPEPVRVWPKDSEGGKGNVFINFSPTRNEAKTLEPGNEYTLRYGLVIFDGDLSEDESAWEFEKYRIKR
jgi:hypothetical protein